MIFSINRAIKLEGTNTYFKIGDLVDVTTKDNKKFTGKILEIEDIGDERIENEDKVCTNKIKIIREVPIEEHKLFKLDKNGNVIKKTDRDGGESCFTYSLAGLLENIKYTDDKQVTLKYDGLRRLNEIEDWYGTTKVEWGVYEHLKSITDYKGRKTSYDYSPMGKLLKMNYPNGKNVKYSYDECLRLSNLADEIQNVGYRYNKNGLLQEKIFYKRIKGQLFL